LENESNVYFCKKDNEANDWLTKDIFLKRHYVCDMSRKSKSHASDWTCLGSLHGAKTSRISICNIRVKHEILVINQAIQYKILYKLKVLDQEKLRGILWTFLKYRQIVFPTFIHFHRSYRNSANIRQHLTVFPSDLSNIYLKYLTRNYEILWKLMKVNES
jgi:hypothetical protein